MDEPSKPGLVSFIKMPTPTDPQGGYQTGATMLKVLGWIRLISLILSALAGLALIIMATAFEAAMIAVVEAYTGNSVPAAIGAVLLIMAIIFTIISIAIGFAFLYWTSWSYHKWATQQKGSLGGIKVFAWVTVVLSGINSLGILSGNVGVLPSVAILVCTIILLVKLSEPGVEQVLGDAPSEAELGSIG